MNELVCLQGIKLYGASTLEKIADLCCQIAAKIFLQRPNFLGRTGQRVLAGPSSSDTFSSTEVVHFRHDLVKKV
jgi:hypothetical protein